MKKVYHLGLFILFSTIVAAQNGPLLESRSSLSYSETIDNIKKSAEERGWKIPAVHNLQETMKKNGMDVLPVSVIEMCQPSFSGEILKGSRDRSISAFMPCRVSVYEKEDGGVYVSRVNMDSLEGTSFDTATLEVMRMSFKEMENILSGITYEEAE